MPRKRLPPRLYIRRRRGREAVYCIRDGEREVSTGCLEGDREGAEKALALFIATKYEAPSSTRDPERITVGECLNIYAREHAPSTAAPERIAWAIEALAEFWADKPVSGVTAFACRLYAKKRSKAPGTIRRELGTMSAALRYCEMEGYLTRAPAVVRPKKPPAKDRWLTREEVARLLRAARTSERSRHVARFILLAAYTGTRRDALLRLQWQPNEAGGWIDLERGLLYRAGSAQSETNKRQPPARLPRQLLHHALRWQRTSRRFVVEYQGNPVREIKRAWTRICDDAEVRDATPHTLRHTAITWAMQRGARIADASGYFGVSIQTLERTYLHHHPDFQASAVAAMEQRQTCEFRR